MSIASRHWMVMASATLLTIGLATPAAHAFNPQPDPPAKMIKQFDPTAKNMVSPGPCRGTKCQHLDIGSPGLLDGGGSLSANGPSATGKAVGNGGARGAAGAGIR